MTYHADTHTIICAELQHMYIESKTVHIHGRKDSVLNALESNGLL